MAQDKNMMEAIESWLYAVGKESLSKMTSGQIAKAIAEVVCDYQKEIIYNGANPARKSEEIGLVSKDTQIKELKNSLETICYHWDEMLNNIDDGPEYEAREDARNVLNTGKL